MNKNIDSRLSETEKQSYYAFYLLKDDEDAKDIQENEKIKLLYEAKNIFENYGVSIAESHDYISNFEYSYCSEDNALFKTWFEADSYISKKTNGIYSIDVDIFFNENDCINEGINLYYNKPQGTKNEKFVRFYM